MVASFIHSTSGHSGRLSVSEKHGRDGRVLNPGLSMVKARPSSAYFSEIGDTTVVSVTASSIHGRLNLRVTFPDEYSTVRIF